MPSTSTFDQYLVPFKRKFKWIKEVWYYFKYWIRHKVVAHYFNPQNIMLFKTTKSQKNPLDILVGLSAQVTCQVHYHRVLIHWMQEWRHDLSDQVVTANLNLHNK